MGVPHVSNVAFFLSGRRWRMAITTAREGLDDAALASDRRHGALFIADSPVPGLATRRFDDHAATHTPALNMEGVHRHARCSGLD